MAREFAKSEIIRQKCSICGSKNKRFTELLCDGKMCGYRLTCCKCGHVDTFFNDEKFSEIGSISKGREVCIQVTTCNTKKCQYYNRYPLSYAARLIDRILSGLGTDCMYDNGMNCKDCEFKDICPNKQNNDPENNIEISDRYQLVINGYRNNNPKFH
jgi:hypothetical protein